MSFDAHIQAFVITKSFLSSLIARVRLAPRPSLAMLPGPRPEPGSESYPMPAHAAAIRCCSPSPTRNSLMFAAVKAVLMASLFSSVANSEDMMAETWELETHSQA